MISIGASEVALHGLLLPVLKTYRTLYPGVHIHITNHSTPQAIAALSGGMVDMALVTTPTVKSSNLSETKICPIREVAACSKAFSQRFSGRTARRCRTSRKLPAFDGHDGA